MPLTRPPRLAETVRKLVARGAHVHAFNILNRLHPSDIAGVLGGCILIGLEILGNRRQPSGAEG